MKCALICLSLLALPALGQAAVIVYNTPLSGAVEVPANASPATGFATVTIDTTLSTMRLEANFSGLLGNVTASHIHASATMVPSTGTAGVATTTPTFPGFPSGVTAGVYDMTFDMTLASSFNASYITANGGTPAAAFSALQSQMANLQSYLNIHTAAFPGGEIRGIFKPVPEPATTGLAVISAAALLIRRRRMGR